MKMIKYEKTVEVNIRWNHYIKWYWLFTNCYNKHSRQRLLYLLIRIILLYYSIATYAQYKRWRFDSIFCKGKLYIYQSNFLFIYFLSISLFWKKVSATMKNRFLRVIYSWCPLMPHDDEIKHNKWNEIKK